MSPSAPAVTLAPPANAAPPASVTNYTFQPTLEQMQIFLDLMKADGGFVGPPGPPGADGPSYTPPLTDVYYLHPDGQREKIGTLILGEDLVLGPLPTGISSEDRNQIAVAISEAETRMDKKIKASVPTISDLVEQMTAETATNLAKKLPPATLQPGYLDTQGNITQHQLSKPITIQLGQTSVLPPNRVRVTTPSGTSHTQGPVGGLIQLNFTGGLEGAK